MSKYSKGDTNFTEQVKTLLNKIYGRSPNKDSVLERAIAYYDIRDFTQLKLDDLARNIAELKSKNEQKSIGSNREARARAERNIIVNLPLNATSVFNTYITYALK